MTRPTALVIEDDEELALVFTEALKASDYETAVVTSGAAAVKHLRSHAPDLVILDLHLPQVDGLTLFQQIKGDDRLVATKVIVATADAQLGKQLDQQANLVLLKPVDFYQLRELAARFKPAG